MKEKLNLAAFVSKKCTEGNAKVRTTTAVYKSKIGNTIKHTFTTSVSVPLAEIHNSIPQFITI